MNYLELTIISLLFVSTATFAENTHMIKLQPENIKKYDESSYIDERDDLRVISFSGLNEGLKKGCYRVYYFYRNNIQVHQYFSQKPYNWDKIVMKYSSAKKNEYDPGACQIVSINNA